MTDSNCRRWMTLSDREATSDPLSQTEQRWYEEHAATCRACAAEARLWNALGDVLERPELLEKSLLPASTVTAPMRSRRRWREVLRSGWMLAAAATALVSFGAAWRYSRPKAVASVVASQGVRFVSVAGAVHLGDRLVRAGDSFSPNERLRIGQGRACFAAEASILACIDSGGIARLSSVEAGLIAVNLEQGRILSRLERQPNDRRYAILTDKATVVATGTEFLVAVDADKRVSVHLHEGKLSIQAGSHQNRDIVAPSALLIDSRIADVEWSDRVMTSDLELLELARLSLHGEPTELDITTRPLGASVSVDGTLLGPTPTTASIRSGHRLVVTMPGYATVTELLPTKPGDRLQRNYELALLPPQQREGPNESHGAAPDTPGEQLPVERAKAAAPPVVTPKSLLAKAHALRAAGKLRDCANTYRQLVGSFSGSDEARVALVSLGELELSVLGQPARALRSFETYLLQPGPLTREARFGRIRALQMLSRKTDEQAAIAAFMRDYPNSVQAERFRRAVQSK